MDYLAKVTVDGVVYEARVNVYYAGDCLEPDFSTVVGYINDAAVAISDIDPDVQDMLLDDAFGQYLNDDGADAAYDAMRDGEWR